MGKASIVFVNQKINIALGLIFLLGLAACGGGGGGGGGGTSSAFNTAEFRANFGLASINALTAYDNSATGQGITVAVIDTGIDQDNSEFAGAISAASTFVVGVSGNTLEDQVGHGTNVAGIIGARKNDSGIHGVAFNSTILAIRADDVADLVFSFGALAVSLDFAVANGASIINLSLGGPTAPTGAYLTALQNAVNAGVIVVAAAGNEGGENTTEALFPARLANCSLTIICSNDFNAQGRMIAVGSVDRNNTLSSFSNPAGDTDAGFLVAPGEDVVSTARGGGTVTVRGTSFAAPHVSGALALLLQRFPTLTTVQAVDLLFTTATDLGVAGTDTSFGRGLLNLQGAFQAQGLAGLPTSRRVIGPRTDFFKTTLSLGASFGNALSEQKFFASTIILDAYDRPYNVDLRNRIISSTPALTVAPFFENNQTQLVSAPMLKGFSLSFDVAKNDPIESANGNAAFSNRIGRKDTFKNAIGTIRFSAELGRDSEISVAHEASTLSFFGNSVTEEASGGVFFNSSWTSSPQLTLLGKGDSLKFSHSISDNTKLDFGIHQSGGFSSSSISGAGHLAQAQLSHKTSNGLSYGLTTGYVSEENSLFSSSSSGAFGNINDNRSLHTSLSASWEINDKTNIFSTYTNATVKPSFSGVSLLGNWSRIHANSFAIGLTTQSQFTDGDRLGISFGQPLRVRKSNVDVTLPVGRDLGGNVLQETQRVDLVPTGRQIDIQLAYSMKTRNQSEITSFAGLSLEPGHNGSASPKASVGFKWELKF